MVETEPPMDAAAQVQIQWNASYAVELCRRATERVSAVAGAHAIYDTSELQRLHRDVNTAVTLFVTSMSDSIRPFRGRVAQT